jgi:signal transduction histidine kinase
VKGPIDSVFGGADDVRSSAVTMSVRQRLSVLIGVLILIVVTVYGGAAYQGVRSSAVEEAGQRLSDAAEQLARGLSVSAGRLLEGTRARARDPALLRHLLSEAPQPEATVAALRGIGADLDIVELWDETGMPLLSTDGDFVVGDPSVREAVVAAVRAAGGAAIGPLHGARSTVYMPTAVAVSSADGERVLGHLVRWIPLQGDTAAQETISGLIGSSSAFYVANASGDVWTDLVAPVDPIPIDLSTAGPTPSTYRTADGESWLGAVARLEPAPWVVTVGYPMGRILAPARATLRQLFLLGLLILAVASALIWWMTAGLTRPLTELAEAARAIGDGELDRRVTEPPGQELTMLARAFNAMTGRVQATHQELEHRIEAVTASEGKHRATQERLRRVIGSTSAVIYEMKPGDSEPKLAWISDNVLRVLGYRVGEALEPGWWRNNVHPDDLPGLGGWIAEDDAGASTRQYRFRHHDGTYRWIRDDQRRLGRDGEGPSEVVGAWLDVTKAQDLEVQLRQAQKLEAVGRLAGGVAHDFNNLLTVILTEAQIARRAVVDDSPSARAVDSLLDAANSAAMLTRQLLTFSRKEIVALTTLDVNETVRSLHRMLRRLVGEDLTLELALADDLWAVRADRGQVEQVVANLVVNAKDAMPHGGKIVIETRNVVLDEAQDDAQLSGVSGDFVHLAISDTGTGMSDEVKAHLFEPFFTTKGVGKGSGLGLATSYTIVQQLGGHIAVHSELAVGTTVALYFPRVEGGPTRSEAEADEATPRGDETVLVVEDEPSVRRVAARILRSHGYTVLEAENGEDALALLGRVDPPDLILTDLVMPRMGGRDLAKQAMARHDGLKVLFMSGYTDDAATRHDLLTREIPFLHKPFDVAELAVRVREVLDAG